MYVTLFCRWRFEALKSRCLLLDREHLLTENKIDFKPVHAFDFHIAEKEQNEARPRIVSSRRSATFENINRKSMTPQKTIKDENHNSVEPPLSIMKEIKEEIPQVLAAVKTEPDEPGSKDININEDKENVEPSMSEIMPPKSSSPKSPLEKPTSSSSSTLLVTEITNTPPSRSILTKQRDLFSKEPTKIVKFSSKEDLVHSFTPHTPSPNELLASSSLTPVAAQNTDKKSTASTPAVKKNTSKAVVNQTRAKSNIVVRRVFVGSKHDQ